MCFPQPNIPKPAAPQLIPPEATKKMELNPALTSTAGKKQKKLGTRKLQIPLGGTGGGTGLNTGL